MGLGHEGCGGGQQARCRGSGSTHAVLPTGLLLIWVRARVLTMPAHPTQPTGMLVSAALRPMQPRGPTPKGR